REPAQPAGRTDEGQPGRPARRVDGLRRLRPAVDLGPARNEHVSRIRGRLDVERVAELATRLRGHQGDREGGGGGRKEKSVAQREGGHAEDDLDDPEREPSGSVTRFR